MVKKTSRIDEIFEDEVPKFGKLIQEAYELGLDTGRQEVQIEMDKLRKDYNDLKERVERMKNTILDKL